MPKVALLVIDMQVGLLEDERYPMLGARELVERCAGLIDRAREAGQLVVFVQHCEQQPPLEPASPGWMLAPGLGAQAEDTVVQKRTPDSFHETELQQVLERHGVGRLVVCGLQSEFCIDTTVRRAFSLGYQTILVKDGHSTCDSRRLTAEQIIAFENRVLSGWFAKLTAADAVDFAALCCNK